MRAVDVRSTESATNLTREDLERLPVARDIQSVALLALGLAKGDDGLCQGGNCGVSFGGSSIAENTIYINGLNVTDFYNRVGSSSVPYAFYKEFQVKTGGYSVEFGRTTGGVINAVTRSGTNEFEYGTEVAWEPHSLQSSKKNHFVDSQGRIIGSYDEYDRTSATFYASGPLIKDKLFFFALYEARDYQPDHTSDDGGTFYKAKEDNGFWGAKIDWQINDKNLLERCWRSPDENEEVRDGYAFDFVSRRSGSVSSRRRFTNNGGFELVGCLYGVSHRQLVREGALRRKQSNLSRFGQNDLECNRVRDQRVRPAPTSAARITPV